MTETSRLLSSPQACAPLPPRVRSLGTSFPLGDTEGEERHTQFHQDLIPVAFVEVRLCLKAPSGRVVGDTQVTYRGRQGA